MATVQVHHPNSLLLPEESPLERAFERNRSHLKGVGELGPEDYARYDRRTLFYDLALDRSGRRVVGISPPMVNLARELLPLTAEARLDAADDWTKLPVRRRCRARHERWELRLPHGWGEVERVDLRVSFRDGTSLQTEARRPKLRQVFQQWSTLQKDNPHEWIEDWVRYAAHQGAERVVLYDNGSEDYGGMAERCATIPADIEVVLVPWAFPYGPPRSRYNCFAQAAQMNHAHRILGACTWQGFLDLDEYPVAPGGLQRLLESQPRWRGLLRMDNYLVPAIEGEVSPGRLPRARDFGHRAIQPRGRGHKCFGRSSGLEQIWNHNGRVRLGSVRGPVPVSRLHFLHFERLTTGWKGARGADRPFDPALHARSTAVQAAFSELEQKASHDAALSATPPFMARTDAP